MHADGAIRLLYIDDDRINTLLFIEACRGLQARLDSAYGGMAARELPASIRQFLVGNLPLPPLPAGARLVALTDAEATSASAVLLPLAPSPLARRFAELCGAAWAGVAGAGC